MAYGAVMEQELSGIDKAVDFVGEILHKVDLQKLGEWIPPICNVN